MPAARALLALVLAAPLAAAAQTTVPRPSPPIVLPAPPVVVVPGYTVVAPIEYHGAIAYHRATGAFGYSYDYPTARDAGVAAINACGEADCVVAIAFRSGCAVLVDGPGGPAVAEGVNAREAEVKARGRCADPQCQTIAWACTR